MVIIFIMTALLSENYVKHFCQWCDLISGGKGYTAAQASEGKLY